MTTVIGLLGPAGAGKSSIAEHLVAKFGAVRYSFAGPLKEMVGRALEFSHDQLFGTQSEKEAPDERYGGKSARWFLQRIGTEGCRKTFGESFWSDQLIAKIQREAPKIAVIDDMRFISEALAVRALISGIAQTGFIWRLESPERHTNADANHASEAEWTDAPYDYVISPKERGLPLLFQLVNDTCAKMGLFPRGAVSL